VKTKEEKMIISIEKIENGCYEFKHIKSKRLQKSILFHQPNEYVKVGDFFSKTGIIMSYRRSRKNKFLTYKGLIEYNSKLEKEDANYVKEIAFYMVLNEILKDFKIKDKSWIEKHYALLKEIELSWGTDEYWEKIKKDVGLFSKRRMIESVMLY